MFTNQATLKTRRGLHGAIPDAAACGIRRTTREQGADFIESESGTIPHGGADTTITVTGDGFVDKSEVHWDGVALVTHAGTTGQLTAAAPAAKLAGAGTFGPFSIPHPAAVVRQQSR